MKNPRTIIQAVLRENGLKGFSAKIATKDIMSDLYDYFLPEIQKKYFEPSNETQISS